MVISTVDGFLYSYDLIKFQKRGEAYIDRTCDFRSSVFLTVTESNTYAIEKPKDSISLLGLKDSFAA
jgi:hypothetical protein